MLKLDLDNETSGNTFARNKKYLVQSRWSSRQVCLVSVSWHTSDPVLAVHCTCFIEGNCCAV